MARACRVSERDEGRAVRTNQGTEENVDGVAVTDSDGSPRCARMLSIGGLRPRTDRAQHLICFIPRLVDHCAYLPTAAAARLRLSSCFFRGRARRSARARPRQQVFEV